MYHKNKFVTVLTLFSPKGNIGNTGMKRVKKKAELFNSFFADQCSLISSSSKLPSKFEYLTQSRLSSITFSTEEIEKIIQNLDPNKAHGHDQISIRILKIYSTSICKPLEILFHRYLETAGSQMTGKRQCCSRLQKM